MGEMITKPDANPILVALANFVFANGGLGYFLLGQKKKAIISWVLIYVASGLLCWIPSIPLALIFAYDAYLLGQKLQNGQSIGENENGLEFLNMIFKD